EGGDLGFGLEHEGHELLGRLHVGRRPWYGDAGDHRHEATAGRAGWRREGDKVVRTLVERLGEPSGVIECDPDFFAQKLFLHECEASGAGVGVLPQLLELRPGRLSLW